MSRTKSALIKCTVSLLLFSIIVYELYPIWISFGEYYYLSVLRDTEPKFIINIGDFYLNSLQLENVHLPALAQFVTSIIIFVGISGRNQKQINIFGTIIFIILSIHLILGGIALHQFDKTIDLIKSNIWCQDNCIDSIRTGTKDAVKFASTYVVFFFGYLGLKPLDKRNTNE